MQLPDMKNPKVRTAVLGGAAVTLIGLLAADTLLQKEAQTPIENASKTANTSAKEAPLLGAPPVGGVQFSQPDHAVDAAIAGAGVVLGRISLCHGALKDGALVAPFPLALSTPAHYRFVCPQGAEDRPQIRAFLDWIVSRSAPMQDIPPGMTMVDAAELSR